MIVFLATQLVQNAIDFLSLFYLSIPGSSIYVYDRNDGLDGQLSFQVDIDKCPNLKKKHTLHS